MKIKYLLSLHFYEEYHCGAINKMLHCAGFTLWGLAIGTANIPLLLISPLVFESGHLYNYIRNIYRKYAVETIPLQIISWIVFVTVGYFLIHLLH